MANGYCAPILTSMAAFAGCDPAKKLRPLGFTSAVLGNMDGSMQTQINQGYAGGHVRSVSVSYRERALESVVSDTPSACDTAVTPAKKEFTLPSLLYREVSFFIPDSLIRQYCQDASQRVRIDNGVAMMDGGPTPVMQEVYDTMIYYGNALLGSMNKALVTQASTGFGKNVVTGATTSTALTFGLGSNAMSDAFTSLMTHIRENEFCNDVFIVGNGPFANLDLIRNWFANGAADNGINKAAMMAAFPEVFYDKDTRTIWGANQIGVYEKGSLGLVSYDKYVGNFARRLANSEYFNMSLPVEEYCCPQPYLDRLTFDVQIREIDCPVEMTINGAAEPTAVQQGVQIVLSKNFSLFQRPDLYNAADPLTGTNGALRFTVTEAS